MDSTADSADRQRPAWPRRYGIALIAVGLAFGLRSLLHPILGPNLPFITFFPAIFITAWLAGLGPALVGVALSALLTHWYFFRAFHSGLADLVVLLGAGLFVGVGIAIGWMGETRLRALARAQGQAAENRRQKQAAERAAAEAQAAARAAAAALAQRLEVEKALRQSEAELSDFFETASIGLHWVGEDGRILRVNPAELEMLGYERDEYVGRNIAEFHVDRAVIDDILERLLAGERLQEYPARLRCKDGRIKDVLINSSAYRVDGRFVHTRCFTRDVTVEKQAHEAMTRLATIVSSSSDAIIGTTLEGVVTTWNPAAERIFGYSAAEMVGRSELRLIPEELHGAERELLERVRRGEAVEFSEVERIRKDGARIWISLSTAPIRDRSGAITGAASIERDITERKLLEEHLREAQRMEAVGTLAGGMAHEVNNQMTVVLGGSEFLLQRPDLPAWVRADLDQIRQAARRSATITGQLLAFGRRQLLRPEPLSLNSVVADLETILQRTLGPTIELRLALGAELGSVMADRGQLAQALLNLVLNAKDAMPQGGVLRIESADVELLPDNGLDGGVDAAPGRYAMLRVSDTGVGMDRATLSRVFEPFFTTKELGKGTGLGLATVYGIVRQSGGYVTAESAPGAGATFTVHLPRITGPLAAIDVAARPGRADRPPRDSRGIAVVVEDEAPVRRMVARVVAEEGFQVLEASNGAEALDAITRVHPDGHLRLVIADLAMPVMGGRELAARLAERGYSGGLLFISGYSDDEVARRGLLAPGQEYLPKPLTYEMLASHIRRVPPVG